MKKQITLIIIFLISLQLMAEFQFFQNPAELSKNKKVEVSIPAFNMRFNAKNSLFNFNTIDIFDTSKYENGELMSDKDKDIFTSDDLNMKVNFQMDLFGVKYNNWRVSTEMISFADLHLLDKQFSEIVFYGNELDKIYCTDAGAGSVAYGFIRNRIEYGIPKEFTLGMLHSAVDDYLSKSKWGIFVNSMPIYLGANINFDYSVAMAKVISGEQRFGSLSDYSFYDYQIEAKYTDLDSNGKLDFSYGLATQIDVLENCSVHFILDDLFSKLSYEDLAGVSYKATFIDSLDYLDEDYEAFDESTQNDSIRYSTSEIDIKPGIIFGVEYYPVEKLQLQMKIDNRRYSLDKGFSFAVGYKIAKFIPIKLILGTNDGSFKSEFQTGLNFDYFDFDLAFSNNSGLFNSAKGIGFRTGVKIKF